MKSMVRRIMLAACVAIGALAVATATELPILKKPGPTQPAPPPSAPPPASPPPAPPPPHAGLPASCAHNGRSDQCYNIAQVRSHQFVETWTSFQGGVIHIDAHVANGVPFGGTSFAPIVTLAFLDFQGKQQGAVQLLFNVPAIKNDEWHHDINIAGRDYLWLQSSNIVASAAENNGARPTQGSWSVTIPIIP